MERSWSAFRFWEVKAEREPHSLESERERERDCVNARALNKMYAGQFKHDLV